jgi:hypothetical protein
MFTKNSVRSKNAKNATQKEYKWKLKLMEGYLSISIRCIAIKADYIIKGQITNKQESVIKKVYKFALLSTVLHMTKLL